MKNKLISLFYILLNFLAFGNVLNLNTNHLPHIEKLSQTDILFQQLSQTIELNDKNSAKNLPLTQEFYTYTVKETDDLLTIHAATNIPYDTIATLNGINDTSENITNRTIIIPSIKGIFVCKNPQSTLEILLYEENKFLLGKHNKLCYNINNKVLFFLPNIRFTATTRAFFIDSNIFMPLEKSNITSDYGMRISPISGNWKFHKGIDLGASEGTPVYACKNGKVAVCVKNDKTFGNYIILNHSNGMTSVYAHLSKINVKKDEIIRKGYQIGNVGSTGAVTGPHLHFEIRKNGIATNPFDFIKK